MENCIKRQEKTIVSEYEINDKKLYFEQRLLTKKEIDEYRNRLNATLGSEEVFKISLKAERNTDEDGTMKIENLTDDDLFLLKKANEEIEKKSLENKTFLIVKSLTKNLFYGGKLKIDEKEIEKNNIEQYIEMLDTDIFDKLFENAEKLSFFSEVEEIEVK
jgi:hypothetical protein